MSSRPPNPRARGVETMATDRAANRFDREQIRRLVTSMPRIPDAAESTGVVLGTTRAEATTTLSAGLASTSAWGFTPMAWPDSTAPGLIGSTFGHFNVVESGWYFIKAHLGIGWSSAPSTVDVFVNPATTTAMGDSHQMTQTVKVPASGNLVHDVGFGAVFLYGDGLDPSMDNVGLLGLDVQWDGGATASFAEIWLDVTRIS